MVIYLFSRPLCDFRNRPVELENPEADQDAQDLAVQLVGKSRGPRGGRTAGGRGGPRRGPREADVQDWRGLVGDSQGRGGGVAGVAPCSHQGAGADGQTDTVRTQL